MSEDYFTICVNRQEEEAQIIINRKLSPKTVALMEDTIKRSNLVTRAVNKGDNAIYIILKIISRTKNRRIVY